jgi:hypothetical protein
MRVRLAAAAAAILVVGCVLSACGGTQATKTVTVTSAAAPKPMAATRTTPNAGANKPRGSTRPATVMTACDGNILAKRGTTSCLFAQNVFYEFWQAEQNGDDAVRAYSPVTQRTYDLACVAAATIVCRGSDGSEVRFSRASLDGYDRAQADAFRCAHDLGPGADTSGCGGASSGGTAPSASGGATAGNG